MRITINIEDLTPGQWGWLDRHIGRVARTRPEETRMCVTMVSPDAVRHVEMDPSSFLELVSALQVISLRTEAVLTPDALPG